MTDSSGGSPSVRRRLFDFFDLDLFFLFVSVEWLLTHLSLDVSKIAQFRAVC